MSPPWLRQGPAAWLLSALAGGLHALSVGWPSHATVDGNPVIDHVGLSEWAWLIQWLATVLWLWVLVAQAPAAAPSQPAGQAARRAFALGGLFATTWLAGSVHWIYISLHRYGELPAALAVLAVLALTAGLSLYMACAAYVYTRWHHGGTAAPARPGDTRWRCWRQRWRGVGSNSALFAATWLLAELARGQIFTGFPWAASGYAHVHGPLSALAPWLGVYGIGAVSAGLAALLLGIAQRRRRSRAATVRALGSVAIVTALVCGLARHDFTQPTGLLAVRLLQGNIPQDQKFDPAQLPRALNWYAHGLQGSSADLVIAPETAIPLLPNQLPDGFWADFTRRVARGHTAVMTGLPLGSFETGYSNSVMGLSPAPDGADATPPAYRYDKHHLVPFGEFIPTGFRWFVDLMRMPLGDFSRGSVGAPSFDVRSSASGTLERVGPNICYEDLFGEELARRFRHADRAPTVLANVSNLGWFDDSAALPQHLRISRLRSLELQRPMVRATNTGATVIIDHRGVVTQSLAPLTQGVLSGLVEGRQGLTPYAWWTARMGLWPLVLLALAVIAPSIVARTTPRAP